MPRSAFATEVPDRAASGGPPPRVPCSGGFSALVLALEQLEALVAATSDAQYRNAAVGVFAGSIGGHVRHCLDHLVTLRDAIHSGVADYDRRERGTPVETHRSAALSLARELAAAFAACDDSLLARPVRVRGMVSGDGAAIESESRIGRELLFVQSHSIHHYALLAAMGQTLGIPLPPRFGYAPATLAHLESQACAPSP